MPAGSELDNLQRGVVRYFPVAPGRLEFAQAVRAMLLRERPQTVAVELPEHLKELYLSAVARLPLITAVLYSPVKHDDEKLYVVIEPGDPFTEAVRTAMEIGAELLFLEQTSSEAPHLPDDYPDTWSITRIGLDAYVQQYRLWPQERDEVIEQHARGMAWKLQGANPERSTVCIVSLNLLNALMDAMQEPQEEPARQRAAEAELVKPSAASLAGICLEYPWLQHRMEETRGGTAPSRQAVQWEVWQEAERRLAGQQLDKLHSWQRRLQARYSRNLAQVSGYLVPTLYELTIAARSIVHDNYAWEVWEAGARYPAQLETSDLPEVDIRSEEVFLHTRRFRLRPRKARPHLRTTKTGLTPRPKENSAGEWARAVEGNSVCSWPAEDLAIEEFGMALRNKARTVLLDERSQTQPFQESLLDGVDIRETLRRWHEGRLYVMRLAKDPGSAGSVVIIFDEDQVENYPWCMSWHGEHQNESDLAFYSTPPFDQLVGPGIGRAEYGGLMMTWPPGRVSNIWADPRYDMAESKAERLLLAGLDYATNRIVVHVAAKPPRSTFRQIAAQLGRTILFIPLGQIAPNRLRHLRRVHVLDGHSRRKTAAQFIRKDHNRV
jgi:hypothetical protein